MEYEHSQAMAMSFDITQCLLRQPHVYMRPLVYKDGDNWIVHYPPEGGTGIQAQGKSPDEACKRFDQIWFSGKQNDKTPEFMNEQPTPPKTQCKWCGKEIERMFCTHDNVWVHCEDGNMMCHTEAEPATKE